MPRTRSKDTAKESRHGKHAEGSTFLVVLVNKSFKRKIKAAAKRANTDMSDFCRVHLLEAANKSVNNP